MRNPDILIVGAGISGVTLAERYAQELGKKVLVIEKRDHIGGNCYDFINEDGILVPKYGIHTFHTKFEDVWEYVNRFSKWRPFEHKILSSVDGKLVPIPINITTVNKLFNLDIRTEEEMKDWLAKNVEPIANPKNSEESALARVGKVIYEKLLKNYTRKQWDVWPHELDPSIMDRVPVRTSFEDRNFLDPHQGMPAGGYTKMFERMLAHKNIEVRLNTDWEDFKATAPKVERLFFTGKIDQFFEYKFGDKLQYRSLRWEHETHNKEYYQSGIQINYPDESIPYTRISEPKHSTGQKHPKTTIMKEYPTWEGEPIYPVPTERNKEIFAKYQKEAEKLEKENIYFVGRLANYKYFNMDQAVKNAFELFERLR